MIWGAQQLRAAEPLVDLRLARIPAVLSADVCATVLGIAMYMYLSGVSEFVQAPSGLGYGFGASVVVAGLCLVPFSVVGMIGARMLPLLDPAGRRPQPAPGRLPGRRRREASSSPSSTTTSGGRSR